MKYLSNRYEEYRNVQRIIRLLVLFLTGRVKFFAQLQLAVRGPATQSGEQLEGHRRTGSPNHIDTGNEETWQLWRDNSCPPRTRTYRSRSNACPRSSGIRLQSLTVEIQNGLHLFLNSSPYSRRSPSFNRPHTSSTFSFIES